MELGLENKNMNKKYLKDYIYIGTIIILLLSFFLNAKDDLSIGGKEEVTIEEDICKGQECSVIFKIDTTIDGQQFKDAITVNAEQYANLDSEEIGLLVQERIENAKRSVRGENNLPELNEEISI